jgi:hypothetical protein
MTYWAGLYRLLVRKLFIPPEKLMRPASKFDAIYPQVYDVQGTLHPSYNTLPLEKWIYQTTSKI